jgi:hypothetical protein
MIADGGTFDDTESDASDGESEWTH